MPRFWPFRASRSTPFFLCGFGKSGTNWIGNLLNLHPHIRCDGEWHFQHFLDAHDEFARYPWQIGHRPRLRELSRRHVESLIRECLATQAQGRPSVTHVGDRSPRPLRELIPGTKTIYALRDGRDVLISYTFHHLRAGAAHHFPAHLREPFVAAQRDYREDPDATGPDNPGLLACEPWVRETLRFWSGRVAADLDLAETLPAHMLLMVRYEDLHADIATHTREMYEFLGVDPALAQAPSGLTTPGFDRQGGEDRRSLFRKGQPGQWREYATDECMAWIDQEAGQVLRRLGYD